MPERIPERVRRFVLTSLPTVPHLETLLLLWRDAQRVWNVEQIASRLYIAPAVAKGLVEDLIRAELVTVDDSGRYGSRREPQDLVDLVDELDHTYVRHLRAITDLIHSNTQRKATRFADAFSWRKT